LMRVACVGRGRQQLPHGNPSDLRDHLRVV
jgi:hypothetical protein